MKPLYDKNDPEVDHIFPRSTLRDKGVDEKLINHYGNFWILPKEMNRNKSNIHPKKYFKNKKISAKTLQEALIDEQQLNFGKYKSFIKERSKKIVNRIIKLTDLDKNYFEEIE